MLGLKTLYRLSRIYGTLYFVCFEEHFNFIRLKLYERTHTTFSCRPNVKNLHFLLPKKLSPIFFSYVNSRFIKKSIKTKFTKHLFTLLLSYITFEKKMCIHLSFK